MDKLDAMNAFAKVDKKTGLPLDETIEQSVSAGVVANGNRIDLMPVLSTNTKMTQGSINDAVGKAGHAGLLLTLIGIVTPIVLLVLGLLLIVVGVLRRKKPAAAAASA